MKYKHPRSEFELTSLYPFPTMITIAQQSLPEIIIIIIIIINTRHDWVGKVIHLELCKKFKFKHTNKWYMHDSESVQENETHKCYIVIYTFIQHHNDTIIKTHEGRKQEGRRKKTSLELYSPHTLLQGFERVVEGLHVRGCWRPNVNFIF